MVQAGCFSSAGNHCPSERSCRSVVLHGDAAEVRDSDHAEEEGDKSVKSQEVEGLARPVMFVCPVEQFAGRLEVDALQVRAVEANQAAVV